MHDSLYQFLPVTSIYTSPYRQLIGERSFFASIGRDSTPKPYYLQNAEKAKTWFRGGLNVDGYTFNTVLCNHYMTEDDAYILTERAAKRTKIKYNTNFDRTKKMDTVKANSDYQYTDERIEVSGTKTLEVGDKLSNLHGQKGTITYIVPDDRFKLESYLINSDIFDTFESSIKKIDVMLNYNSVISRGAFGMFCEIGYSYLSDVPTITSSFAPVGTCKLIDTYTATEHDAVVGKLHFMVLDKLSKFIINKHATVDAMTRYALYANVGDDRLWNMLPYQI